MLGQASWEEAESALQKQAARLAMEKAGPGVPPVRYLFSGDLLGQLIATSFGVMDLKLPLFGLYGACSTIGEAIVVEDSPTGIRAGKAAGALVCALRQPDGTPLDQREADVVLDDLFELVDLIA